LVTHAAGCNALVGALTNQPVLIDFGQASLTMAVRKYADHLGLSKTTTQSGQGKSSLEFGLSEEYEVKTLASSDHLRVATFRPVFASRVPFRLPFQPSSSGSGAKSMNHHNSSLGSIRRNASLSSASSPRSDSAGLAGSRSAQPSPGLWTKPSGPDGRSETPRLPKAEHVPLWEAGNSVVGTSRSDENSGLADRGILWKVSGSTVLNREVELGTDSESGPTRELGPKRRWTTNQADA
jgi:hypothetical protein